MPDTYDIYVRPNAPKKVVRAAVRKINKQLGADIVNIVNNKAKADATFGVADLGDTRGGVAYTSPGSNRRDRLAINRNVNTYDGTGRNPWVATAAHEIGHGLGLGHTKNPNNVLASTGDQLFGTRTTRFSKKQEREVRQNYRNGKYK